MKLTKAQEGEAKIVHDLYWENYLKAEVKALSLSLDNQYIQLYLEKESFNNKKDSGLWESLEEQLNGDIKMHNRTTKVKSVDGFVFFKEQCDLYVFKKLEWTFYSKFIASSLMQKKDNEFKMIHHHYSMPKEIPQENESVKTKKISQEKLQTRELVKK